jgi:1,4-dihydroxy-2-naphthoate octaprenyltransferase
MTNKNLFMIYRSVLRTSKLLNAAYVLSLILFSVPWVIGTILVCPLNALLDLLEKQMHERDILVARIGDVNDKILWFNFHKKTVSPHDSSDG